MYGFEGTECKIAGCENPVWPNKTLGFCNKHYQRYNTGRMAPTGELLPPPVKIKTCESCGAIFQLKKMERNVRFCKQCRPAERRKLQNENSVGIFRRGKNPEYRAKKYVAMVLDRIISECKSVSRKRDVLNMRLSGMTYSEIAKIKGCSKQNIHHICSKHLSNTALNSDAQTPGAR